jgi:hypothetical protein
LLGEVKPADRLQEFWSDIESDAPVIPTGLFDLPTRTWQQRGCVAKADKFIHVVWPVDDGIPQGQLVDGLKAWRDTSRKAGSKA